VMLKSDSASGSMSRSQKPARAKSNYSKEAF
jgi:hypothetical protein